MDNFRAPAGGPANSCAASKARRLFSISPPCLSSSRTQRHFITPPLSKLGFLDMAHSGMLFLGVNFWRCASGRPPTTASLATSRWRSSPRRSWRSSSRGPSTPRPAPSPTGGSSPSPPSSQRPPSFLLDSLCPLTACV